LDQKIIRLGLDEPATVAERAPVPPRVDKPKAIDHLKLIDQCFRRAVTL
jgi:hypothetical protein